MYSSDHIRPDEVFRTSNAAVSFGPEMECLYRSSLLNERRTSSTICALAALAIWATIAAFDPLRIEFPSRDSPWLVWIYYLNRWIVLAALIATVSALWLGYERYDRVVLWVYIATGVAASITTNIAKSRGGFSADSAMIGVVMSAFLPLGLTFRQAFTGSLIVTIAAIVAPIVLLTTAMMAANMQLILTILVAFSLAAVGGFFAQQSHRAQFSLRGRLAEQAATDHLTGLFNRRYFEWHAGNLLNQCLREKTSVTLALVDVDHFKKYNDTYGHMDGDAALVRVSATLRSCVRRPLDIVSRVGGEEFCILFYGTTIRQAVSLLEGALKSVAALDIAHAASPTRTLTISIGAAEFKDAETLDALYQRADCALYEAKRAGRNRVVMAPPADTRAA